MEFQAQRRRRVKKLINGTRQTEGITTDMTGTKQEKYDRKKEVTAKDGQIESEAKRTKLKEQYITKNIGIKRYQSESGQEQEPLWKTLQPGMELDISIPDSVSQKLGLLAPSLLVIYSNKHYERRGNQIDERDIVKSGEKNVQIHLTPLNNSNYKGSNHFVVSQQKNNVIYVYDSLG